MCYYICLHYRAWPRLNTGPNGKRFDRYCPLRLLPARSARASDRVSRAPSQSMAAPSGPGRMPPMHGLMSRRSRKKRGRDKELKTPPTRSLAPTLYQSCTNLAAYLFPKRMFGLAGRKQAYSLAYVHLSGPIQEAGGPGESLSGSAS